MVVGILCCIRLILILLLKYIAGIGEKVLSKWRTGLYITDLGSINLYKNKKMIRIQDKIKKSNDIKLNNNLLLILKNNSL